MHYGLGNRTQASGRTFFFTPYFVFLSQWVRFAPGEDGRKGGGVGDSGPWRPSVLFGEESFGSRLCIDSPYSLHRLTWLKFVPKTSVQQT